MATPQPAKGHCRIARHDLDLYLAAVVRMSRLGLYEQLLALWHVLHMPLFILLAMTAVFHIIAVHQY